jgi:hypothetical protein
MSHNIVISVLFFIFSLPLASQAVDGKARNPKPDVAPKQKVDVCALLTSADIQAAQGEPVKETKPSTQPGGGMVISQCLFNTTTSSKSVTLALVAPDPANTSSMAPRKFWLQQFHSARVEPGKKSDPGKGPEKPDGEGEEELREPRAITQIGDEAYWVGNRFTGALYVLRGDIFMRLSVGGVREESARIEKSKVLAKIVLKRLAAPK